MNILAILLFVSVCYGHPWSFPYKRLMGTFSNVSTNDLLVLQESVGGRLYPGTPIELPCFSKYENGSSNSSTIANISTCINVGKNRNNGSFISNAFGGYMTPDFSTCITADQGCVMDKNAVTELAKDNATCYQGSVPNYYIDVREIEDIRKGIEFARTHKVPLVIKNTGHDYSGRSSGPNSLALWMHNYRPVIRMYDNFVPDGCTTLAGPAVAASTGHQVDDIQAFTHEYGYMFLSGVSGSVGASSGWILGGGHSPFSPKFGLGVDNVLQMKAMLPNGTVIIANRCQNQDMFFALRGGGGNAFGILLETTYIAHKEFPVEAIKLSFDFESKNETVALLTANAEKWNQAGWGTYIDINSTSLAIDGNAPFISPGQAEASMKPLIDYALFQQNAQIEFKTYPNYWAYLKSPTGIARGATAIGDSFVVSSRLIQKANFEEGLSRQALNDAITAEDFFITTIGPASFQVPESDQPGGPGEASITPAWRDSFWFIMLRAAWDSGNPADTKPSTVVTAIEKNTRAIEGLRKLTPNGGTYFNEGHPYEPEEGKDFWGPKNYDRLLSIKRTIDPDNILTCWQCIGYDKNDPRFSCYPLL